MTNIHSIAKDFMDAFSNFYNMGVKKSGELGNYAVKIIKQLPQQMQQNQNVAVGTFAAVNIVFFTTLYLITSAIEKGFSKSKKDPSLAQKTIKQICLSALFGGSAFGLNKLISKGANYPLNPAILAAISTAVVVMQFVLKQFFAKNEQKPQQPQPQQLQNNNNVVLENKEKETEKETQKNKSQEKNSTETPTTTAQQPNVTSDAGTTSVENKEKETQEKKSKEDNSTATTTTAAQEPTVTSNASTTTSVENKEKEEQPQGENSTETSTTAPQQQNVTSDASTTPVEKKEEEKTQENSTATSTTAPQQQNVTSDAGTTSVENKEKEKTQENSTATSTTAPQQQNVTSDAGTTSVENKEKEQKPQGENSTATTTTAPQQGEVASKDVPVHVQTQEKKLSDYKPPVIIQPPVVSTGTDLSSAEPGKETDVLSEQEPKGQTSEALTTIMPDVPLTMETTIAIKDSKQEESIGYVRGFLNTALDFVLGE